MKTKKIELNVDFIGGQGSPVFRDFQFFSRKSAETQCRLNLVF
jgi:pectin methylesterase-like acyl-CoA thioesterase